MIWRHFAEVEIRQDNGQAEHVNVQEMQWSEITADVIYLGK